MRYREMARRLAALEAQAGMHEATFAVYLSDTAQVAVCETDERLSPSAFLEQYPAGVLVKSITREMWEAI